MTNQAEIRAVIELLRTKKDLDVTVIEYMHEGRVVVSVDVITEIPAFVRNNIPESWHMCTPRLLPCGTAYLVALISPRTELLWKPE